MSTDESNKLNEEQIKLINQLVSFHRLGYSLDHSPDFTASPMADDSFVIEAHSKDNKQKYSISDVNGPDFIALNNKGYINLFPSPNKQGSYKFTLEHKAYKLVPATLPKKPGLLARLENLPDLTKLLGVLISAIVAISVAYLQFIKPVEISTQFTQTAEAKQITQTSEVFNQTATHQAIVPLTETAIYFTVNAPTETTPATLIPISPTTSNTPTLMPTKTRTVKPTPSETSTFTLTPTKIPTSTPTFKPSPSPTASGSPIFTPYPTSSGIIGPNNKNDLVQLVRWQATSAVYSVAISPNGEWIASGEQNGMVTVRSASTGTILHSFNYGSTVRDVSFSPDGKWLAVAGNGKMITLWHTDTWSDPVTLAGHNGIVSSISFSPDGNLLASGGYDDKTVRLWKMDTWESQQVIVTPEEVNVVAFSPDSKVIAVGVNDALVRVWDINGAFQNKFENIAGPSEAIISLAFSPDGRLLVSGTRDLQHPFQVWDFASIQLKQGIGGPCQGTAVVFSPNGLLMVTGDNTNTLKIWRTSSTSSFTVLRYLTNYHQEVIYSVVFSNDGKLMVTSSKDKTIRLWGIK